MKGNKEVIQVLNDVLAAELVAINQYILHAEMREGWHYKKLASITKKQSIEEMKHAEKCIERLLYLETAPMMKSLKLAVGKDVPEQLGFDRDLEKDAIARLNEGMAICRTKGDNGTLALLAEILADEEEHLDWLEAELEQLGQVGAQNYLARWAATE